MQVGGIGYVAGDEGGGSFLSRAAVRLAFDACFRFGPKTKIIEDVFAMYQITDKKDFSDAIVSQKINSTYLIQALFKRANEGDVPAIQVLETAGENMAKSIAGVIQEIHLQDPVHVILAGSVWSKATSPHMQRKFEEVVQMLSHRSCQFIVLKEPPVLGAILWALELASGRVPDLAMKSKVLTEIIKYQNQVA